jgi:hypothetical protein
MSLLNFEEAFGSNALNDNTGLTIYGPYWSDIYNYPQHLSALTYAVNAQRRDVVRQIKQLEKFHTRTADIFETSTYKLVKVRLRDVKLRRIKLNDGNRLGPKQDQTYNALGQTEWFWYEFKLPRQFVGVAAVCDLPGNSKNIFTLPGEARLSEDGTTLEIPMIDAYEVFELGTDEIGQYMKLWFYMPKTESRSYRQEFCRWLSPAINLSDSIDKLAKEIDKISQLGSSELSFRKCLSAITDCPVALSNERLVEVVQNPYYGQILVTDKNTYTYKNGIQPSFQVGDNIEEGDFLFNNVRWTDFYDGIPDWLSFINFPGNLFGSKYDVAVVAINRDIVYGYDQDNNFKMRFPVVVRYRGRKDLSPVPIGFQSELTDRMFVAVYKNINELEINPTDPATSLALEKFWEAFDRAGEGKVFNYVAKKSGYTASLNDLNLLDTGLNVLEMLAEVWLKYGFSLSLITGVVPKNFEELLQVLKLASSAWRYHIGQIVSGPVLVWEESATLWEIAQMIWD